MLIKNGCSVVYILICLIVTITLVQNENNSTDIATNSEHFFVNLRGNLKNPVHKSVNSTHSVVTSTHNGVNSIHNSVKSTTNKESTHNAVNLTHDTSNSKSCSPNLNKGIMRTISLIVNNTLVDEKHSSHYCEELNLQIIHIIIILKWSHMFIIYDSDNEEQFVRIMERFAANGLKVTTYDVTHLTPREVNDTLVAMYVKKQDVLEIIVLLGNKTFDMLQRVNEIDNFSNKTTNFRTNAKWIIVSHDDNSIIQNNLHPKLKHVLILRCKQFKMVACIQSENVRTSLNCSFRHISGYLDSERKCSHEDIFPNAKYKLNRRHLLIGTMTKGPYLAIRRNRRNEISYTGIVPDVADILAQTLNFTYTFVLPTDGRWGVKTNDSWNGMMRQLIRHEVDMVIADLTITGDRHQFVDFIIPALVVENIGVVYKRGINLENSWFKTFRPLQTRVYILIITSVVIISFLFFLVDQDIRCGSGNPGAAFRLSVLLTSLLGFLALQGNGLLPKRQAPRILVAFFWMFCIVITGTYIGNLTATLSDTNEKRPFSSLEELTERRDWIWGTRGGGYLQETFEKSTVPTFQKIWKGLVEFNATNPDVLRFDTAYHVNRILNTEDKYAFLIMDAAYFAYTRKDCVLEAVESAVISSLYNAIAVTKNSHLKPDIEAVMWGLFNSGLLRKIVHTHSHDTRPFNCTPLVQKKRPVVAGDMLGSVFICILGLSISLLVLLCEVIYKQPSR